MRNPLISAGITDVKVNGNALAIKLPTEWLATNGLKLGDHLFSVATLDGAIRVHMDQVEWCKAAKIRRASNRGAAYVTLSAQHTRQLGIKAGDTVTVHIDSAHRLLLIRKVLT